MAKLARPRHGTLQFWPRKRAEKVLPSVNWKPVKGEGILGFITYKAAMATAIVKDNTADSMTKNKKMFIPVTILEAPNMKIYSVRFYKFGKVMKDVVVSNDKELKRVLKVSKNVGNLDKVPEGFDDIRILVYSLAKQTSIKKTPDLIEVAVNAPNKLEFVKSLVGKEISLNDFIDKKELLDTRATTKGKGLEGPVPRFGLTLKGHKSEKGVRRPGSLAPWHPARVTFRTPMAGQMGLFSRVNYNNNVITFGNVSEKNINPGTGFKHYGNIKTNYLVLKGRVQGPVKRVVLVTPSFRPTKRQGKKKYQFQELLV